MQDYIEDLLYQPEDYNGYYTGDAIEADLHEEDDIDEFSAF
ncbi:hypothetical protein SAMN02745866_02602 [Alteromonadaceae bacterium Bs31]|nr:hypothetical protein SAMN02745866_02602 [Alteromonadaceae bacterium Bs31]